MDNRNQALPKGTILRGKVYTYRIEKVLGQGTFGITYLASTSMHGPLGEVTVQVAVKEFFAKELDSRMADGTVSARTEDGVAHKYARAFLRESENLSKMKHPGIVNVLESFEDKGTCYYSMEYLSGGTLDDKVKGRGIPEQEALNLTTKIGEALGYMHERKVMHLDLKPKNVMLKADGSPVIIDFGLSKQYDGNGEPESSTTIGLGTPGYAPIEQANQTTGRMFQPTIDIYALGATLYKMLTGETPPNASEVLNMGFPEESLWEKRVSAATVTAVRKAMSPITKDRPQNVAEFLSLITGEEETTIEEPPTKPNPRPTPKPKPKSKIWLWALLACAIVAAIITAIVLGGRKEKPGVDEPTPPVDTTIIAPTAEQTPSSSQKPETKPEPVTPGSVKVSSTPSGATIWLDGKNTKKTTPEIIEDITPGKHSIKLVLEGYNDYSGSITIASSKRAELAQTLKENDEAVPVEQPTPAEKPTTGSINGHEWVDLGLSVKWATCNVGASSPSDYGSYYAWGETKPKSEYRWDNYKFKVTGDSWNNVTFNKYNTASYRGTVDNKKKLELADDAARQNWGGSWRMPTDAELTELREKCTWTWTTQEGKNGYRVTSKTNGNSIFLPAAGFRGIEEESQRVEGHYWSSFLGTDDPESVWVIYFHSDEGYYNSYEVHICYFPRFFGIPVRPVSE